LIRIERKLRREAGRGIEHVPRQSCVSLLSHCRFGAAMRQFGH
jgi:hypothetical protein